MAGGDPTLNSKGRPGDLMVRDARGWGPRALSSLLRVIGTLFIDTLFRVANVTDLTKQLGLSLGNQATNTTITLGTGAQTASRAVNLPVLSGTGIFGVSNTTLTSGRIPYATTNGVLTDTTNLRFDGTNLTVAAGTGTFGSRLKGDDLEAGDSGTYIGRITYGSSLIQMGAFSNIGIALYANSAQVLSSTAAGIITIPNTTASTTSSTGALIVTGGVGIGGAVFTGASITMPNGNSISTAGGICLYGDANQTIIRGRATSGIIFQTNAGGTNAQMTDAGVFTLQTTADATALGTAGFITPGGVSIAKTVIAAKGQGWGVTSTATAAGTTVLAQASTMVQSFTGSTTQTITMPAANLWGAGIAVTYVINNQSSGTVTPTRAGSDTFQGGGTTSAVLAGATTIFMSDGVSIWLKVSTG